MSQPVVIQECFDAAVINRRLIAGNPLFLAHHIKLFGFILLNLFAGFKKQKPALCGPSNVLD